MGFLIIGLIIWSIIGVYVFTEYDKVKGFENTSEKMAYCMIIISGPMVWFAAFIVVALILSLKGIDDLSKGKFLPWLEKTFK